MRRRRRGLPAAAPPWLLWLPPRGPDDAWHGFEHDGPRSLDPLGWYCTQQQLDVQQQSTSDDTFRGNAPRSCVCCCILASGGAAAAVKCGGLLSIPVMLAVVRACCCTACMPNVTKKAQIQ